MESLIQEVYRTKDGREFSRIQDAIKHVGKVVCPKCNGTKTFSCSPCGVCEGLGYTDERVRCVSYTDFQRLVVTT